MSTTELLEQLPPRSYALAARITPLPRRPEDVLDDVIVAAAVRSTKPSSGNKESR
jgi:hypothetical protein